MNRIAVIPARGGSKRIPDKNIRLFAGKPMIHHAIRCARESGLFARIIVSTDSERISSVAKEAGAEVPFLRSDGNADDHAPLAEAVVETLERLGPSAASLETVCCLVATSPLLQVKSLAAGLELMVSDQLDAVVSVQRFRSPILRAMKYDEEGYLRRIWPEYQLTRSQDLTEAWHDAGQFYWVRRSALMRDRKLIAGKARGYTLPPLDAVDIDNIEDWSLAEQLYQFHHSAKQPD
jgi:pseudaminic acid cytidylyltransferase